MLHRGDVAENKDTSPTPVKDESNSDVAVQSSDSDQVGLAKVNVIYKHRTKTRLKVLPVRVTNAETGAQQDVLALLDGGSDTHLISKRLYDELALTGVPVRNRMSLTDGETRTSDTFETQLEILGLNEAETFELTDVRVVDKLSDLSASVPKETDFERYPHLADIALPIINRDSVDLLIGLNHRILHEIVERREAGENMLCAGRTVLGWFLYGPDGQSQDAIDSRLAMHVTCINDIDNCGILDFRAPSVNDDRASKIMQDSCVLTEGHYQIALPWCCDNPDLPNNRSVALSRLNSLGRRLKVDPDTLTRYNTKITEMIELKHAIEIDSNQSVAEGKVWYIPHHDTKTEKFRVVFDASSRFEGISVNDKLLQGPNNSNILLGVLLRFRLHECAFISDIKSMLYQVKVDPADRCALRFLYWIDGDPDKPVKTVEMTVHAFGLTSSPSVAGMLFSERLRTILSTFLKLLATWSSRTFMLTI